jgi:hypothetical protein
MADDHPERRPNAGWRGAAHAAATPPTPTRSLIASATAHDFRIELTAERTSSGSAPTATVHVAAYAHTAHGWQPRGEQLLVSPALGWSQTHHVQLEHDTLVR